MIAVDAPALRADAARNVRRIVDAAYGLFSGARYVPSMEDVAAAAGVGVATVYRRFPTREDLLRAVLDRRWEETITPALRRAAEEPDARQAIRLALDSAARFVAGDRVMLSVASDVGLMTMDLAQRFCDPVGELLERGQRDGVFRPDLVPEDVPRFVSMLFGTLPSFEPNSESDGWQRYLDLMLDMLTGETTPLPPARPVHDHPPLLPPSGRERTR
jgi:AcrR family transcriptional regulator